MRVVRLLLLGLYWGLGVVSLMAQELLPTFPKRLSKEAVKAEKHFEYLKSRKGYTPLGTLVYRSRKELPKSLLSAKSVYVYMARLSPYDEVEKLIAPSDSVSLATLDRYKSMGLPSAPIVEPDLLDGWLAVHYFSTQGAQDSVPQRQAMVFMLDERLEQLLDASEWYAFDYRDVVQKCKDYREKEEKRKVKNTISAESQLSTADVHQNPEVPAEYKGGVQEMFRYIASQVRYPEVCVEMGIEGRVVLKFVVEPDGSISGVDVVRGVENSIDLEAMRVLLSMPRMKPAMQGGMTVRSQMMLPIVFRLSAP